MQSTLFDFFGTSVPSYFALLITGFLLATSLGALWARRLGENPDTVVDLGLAMLVWGIVGARLLHVLADGFFWDYVHLCTDPSQVLWKISQAECLAVSQLDSVSALLGDQARALGVWDAQAGGCRPQAVDCFAWARFWAGGLTFYGGLLLALPAGYRLLRRERFPVRRALDMGGLVIPVGLAFGRMGCVLGGCCFGKPWSGPLALTFPAFSPASVAQAAAGLLPHAHARSLPVHPTQLYEAFGSLALAAGLYFGLHGRKRYDGQVFLGFLAGYAGLRFVIEFARADDRGAAAGLSTSQWIGLGLVAVAWALHRRWRLGPQPDAPLAVPPPPA